MQFATLSHSPTRGRVGTPQGIRMQKAMVQFATVAQGLKLSELIIAPAL
jgi:hypothetical protein